MTAFSSHKGRREERANRDAFKAAGFDVRLHGIYEPGDLTVSSSNWSGLVEAKVKANGYSTIYKEKGDADILVIRANNKPALIVMERDEFFRLLDPLLHGVDE